MGELALLGYVLPGVIFIALLIINGRWRWLDSDALLNNLTIAHGLVLLGITLAMLFASQLPVYYLPERYFAFDRLAGYEIFIATVIFSLAAIYSRGYAKNLLSSGEIESGNTRLFYGAFNLLLTIVVLGFLANNIALFWIFLELSTLVSAILIVILKAHENIIAALKYVFIVSTAMLFAFVGIIILFAISRDVIPAGTFNWDSLLLIAPSLPVVPFSVAFIFILVGFGAKSGLVPFHTWLPAAYSRAPSVVSVLLSGVVTNAGIYGILRMNAIATQSSSGDNLKLCLVGAGVVSIAVAAFSLVTRTNTKKLIAFSSIEHMGLMVLGVGLASPLAIFWVLFHAMGHSLSKALLFFSAGIFHRQYESNKYFQIKNAFKLQPLASWGLITGSLAVIGVPLLPIFLSKLNILASLAEYSLIVLGIVLVLLFFIASSMGYYMVRSLSRNEEEEQLEPYHVPSSMKWPIVIVIFILFVLGVYFPDVLADLLNGIIKDLKY